MSPTLEEARAEIEKARASLEEAKTTKAQREQEATNISQQLQEAQEKIPNIFSQRSLRQRFSGLEGRKQRQAIQKVSEDIETSREEIEQFKTDLAKHGEDITVYERDVLTPYEQQVTDAQRLQEEYDADVQAFNQAQKFYADRVPLSFVEGKEYNYLKQMYASGTAYDEYIAKTSVEIQNKIDAVKAGITTFDTAFPKDYLNRLRKSGIVITRENQFQTLLPELSRDIKKDIPKVPKFNITGLATGIGTVSAQPFVPMSYAQPDLFFTTAGSPIRVEPLIPEKKTLILQETQLGYIGTTKQEDTGQFIVRKLSEGVKFVSGKIPSDINAGAIQAFKDIGLGLGILSSTFTQAKTEEQKFALKRAGLEYTPENIEKLRVYREPAVKTTEFLMLGALTSPKGIIKEVIPLPRGTERVGNILVQREPLIVDTKISTPVGAVSKPTQRYVYVNELGQVVQKDIGSKFNLIGQFGQEGSKVVVTTKTRDLFGLKPIYQGIPSNVKSYKEALRLLQEQGLGERQARELIRLRRPQLIQEKISGDVMTLTTDESITGILGGQRTRTYLSGEKGGVKYLQKKPETSLIADVSKPSGEVKDIQLYGFERTIKTPSKEIGKQTEYFKGVGGSKLVKSLEVKTKFIKDLRELEKGEKIIIGDKQFELYSEVEVSKRLNPLRRSYDTGKAKVLVEKGEPTEIVTDLSVLQTTGFQGGGKKSSEQFLKQLYNPTELKASQVLGLKPKIPKKVKVPEVISDISLPQASQYAGLGLYERTGGIGLNIIKDLSGDGKSNVLSGGVSRNIGGELIRDSGSDFSRGFRSDIVEKTITQTGVSAETGLSTKQDTGLQLRSGQSQVSGQLNILKTGQREIEILRPKQETSLREIQRLRQIEITALKFFERLKTEQISKSQTQQIFETPRLREPRIPRTPRIILLPKVKPKKVKTAKEVVEDLYGFYVRKKGQDIFTEGFTTQREAESAFGKEVRQTLRASGGITFGGKPIKTNIFGLIPSKVDQFRLIEPKRKRIKRGSGEVSEIQYLRGVRKRRMFDF